MRRHVNKNRSTKGARRLSITTVLIAVALLAVASVAVASRQKLSAKARAETQQSPVTTVQDEVSTVSESHQGLLEDRDQLAEGLGRLVNQSTEGLTQVHHSDGSVSINLEDRFQNVSVAKVTDGKLSQACLDNPQSAGKFFSIDPKLIDSRARSQAAPVTK